ncbi:SIMPL domain-containing protein [Actinoplanes regularis]|uniref:SIMPL domain-containing protein n=1 Tax=Actinoplanes regularis TaxID=52697 RepID=UPI002553469C|nr:SIMPL domain-containing protein [Actinoplanes regularis]
MDRSRVPAPVPVVLATLAMLSTVPLSGQPAAASTHVAVDSPSADQDRESVLVTGEGEVFGEPDTLAAEFAVQAVAAKVDEALSRADAAATRMRDALVRAGTAKSDLQTSNVNISSNLDDDQKITGYTVNQGLTAKIRNLPRAGATMSAAITAAGDAGRLNGVSFTIENDAALLTEARKKAFADARGKAELYAREAGRSLGRVVRVTEGASGGGEQPVWKDHRALMAAPMPIEPGRQRVAVSVTVEWALGSPSAPSRAG